MYIRFVYTRVYIVKGFTSVASFTRYSFKHVGICKSKLFNLPRVTFIPSFFFFCRKLLSLRIFKFHNYIYVSYIHTCTLYTVSQVRSFEKEEIQSLLSFDATGH